jgi:hypothetical protein
MAARKCALIVYALASIFITDFLSTRSLYAFANLTKNDPYPLYSAIYPYDFLGRREKLEAFFRHHEIYEEDRFRISLTGFRQTARCATATNGVQTEIGNLPYGIGLNMGALFFDPAIAQDLATILGINATVTDLTTTATGEQGCFNLFRTPSRTDPNQQFGFLSLPMHYRKYGVRLESEILLIDNCFDAVGLKIQASIADIRQTVTYFFDQTCTATIISCPAHNETVSSASGCQNENCCLGYSCDCKKLMIRKVMEQKNTIAHYLNLDFCDTYHDLGLEDLRLGLYWRHIYDLNPFEINQWPRTLFIPFLEAQVAIPMSPRLSPRQIFGVPLGNNGHTSAGVAGGFTLDFLDTIDIAFEGGFTYFFKQKYCNQPMPTNPLESNIYPYKADVIIKPGTTWHFAATMNAFHFIDNLSVWVQLVIVNHKRDHINLCKSLIPANSVYSTESTLGVRGKIPNLAFPVTPDEVAPSGEFANTDAANTLENLSFLPAGQRGRGFLLDQAECGTKWESQLLNVGFTYDISPYVNLGVAWQAPLHRRNAYRSTTFLGSITMTY